MLGAARAHAGRGGWLLGLLVLALASSPFAVYGLVQLAQTAAAQLVGPARITDFVALFSGAWLLLHAPAQLYHAGAVAALDRALTAGSPFDRPFSLLPGAALTLAPLAALPYGLAYALWLGLGLGALGLSVWLLAPGRRGWWLLGLALYLPVQLGLVMGQTSPLALLGLCVLVRLLDRHPWLAGLAFGLSPATWKPPLLCVAVGLALLVGRRWRTLLGCVAVPVVLSLVGLALGGPGLVADYRAQGAEVWAEIATGTGVEYAGQTLLGLAQALLGAQPRAIGLAVVLGGAAELLVAWLWRGGLAAGARRELQLAALPLAGTLVTPHALAYDLTLWLASAWLLLRYAAQRPRYRAAVWLLCGLGWASGSVAVLGEGSGRFPLAALCGVLALGLIGWCAARECPDA